MSKTNIVKKNHYIPKFLLKGFCDTNEQISIYNKKNNKHYRLHISNAACQNHLYSTYNDNIKKDFLESIYTKIEELAKAPLEKLIKERQFPINEEERENVAIYFATLVIRSPLYLEYQKEKRYAHKYRLLIESIIKNKATFKDNMQEIENFKI